MIEYSISVKDENSSLVVKDVTYDTLHLSRDNPDLVKSVNAVYERFKAESGIEEPDATIVIKARMIW